MGQICNRTYRPLGISCATCGTALARSLRCQRKGNRGAEDYHQRTSPTGRPMGKWLATMSDKPFDGFGVPSTPGMSPGDQDFRIPPIDLDFAALALRQREYAARERQKHRCLEGEHECDDRGVCTLSLGHCNVMGGICRYCRSLFEAKL